MTTNQQSTNNVEQISVSKARSSSMPSINSVFAKIKTRHSSQKAITQKVPVPTQTQPISISPDLIEKKLQEEIDQVQASFVELENVQFGEEEGVGVNSEDGKVVAQIKPKKQTTMEVMKRITSFGAILNKKQVESSQQQTQDQQEETQVRLPAQGFAPGVIQNNLHRNLLKKRKRLLPKQINEEMLA
eukprot:TRINITY_DN32785_c0_g2_i2.p1 TRINITY_DN32785_c0_g2~~TRINITY_DN32785_c0_g2_i2.p1  ORF type:complete len:194 (-),score=21.02 TRINITY_DN32785_c0_g2_i2:188-748(-)